LGYSRRQYLRFVEAQDFATTLREHVRAFAHLEGVVATCLYDNMKVVVTGYEDDVPIYNPRFLAFATHYGFWLVACRPRRPQTKGKVERPFAYVESSLLNGRSFETLDHLNETTAWWLAHVADVRVLREAKKTPLQLHEEERPHLIPLPAQPYEILPVTYRTVNVEGLITYRQNGYSVPWRYIGSVLPVRVTETEVIIYSPQVEEIARHPLSPRTATGQRSVLKEHRPTEDRRQRQAQLEERFAELGETGRRFLEGLLRMQRYGKDFQVLRIPLRSEQLDAVLGRAESEGMSHLEFLRALLIKQAGQRRERSIARRIREAGFAENKTLADFDWQFNAKAIDRVQIESLAEGEFISRKRNLVMVGQSGVGKSHIIEAIGQRACVLGYRVKYSTSALLLNDLTASLADQTLARRLRYYAKFDLVILDEFGFERIERAESPQSASLLHKFITARNGRSTALVSNVDFNAWGAYLGDPPLAMAFLDRIVDGAIIVKINGKSYRVHRAQRASSGG